MHVRSWQAAYRGLLPQEYLDALTPQRRLGEWEAVLGATCWPTTGTLVLEDRAAGGGGVAGFACVGPTRDNDGDPASVGELRLLYLDPDHFGTGGGTVLLAAAGDRLRAAGFVSATAWVLETNDAARAFYERRGWRPDGARQRHDWGTFVVTDVRYAVVLGP